MQITKQDSIKLIVCLAMGLSLSASTLAWAEPSSANTMPSLALEDAQSGQALDSYMEFFVDPSGMTTLPELFSPSYEDAFTPLEDGIPLADTGSTWLRLSIVPDSEKSHVIALGSELATDVILYVPDFAEYNKSNESHANSAKASVATSWQEIFIPHGEAITLPAITDAKLLEEMHNVSVPIYIHMAGTPEPWFAPQLRTVTDIAHDNSRLIHIGMSMMLAAVLALCLLRAFTEKGQWRLWTTFFTAALLVESLVGLPSTPHGSIGLAGLPSVLAPAIALMLLPHIARHMLRRTEFSHKHIPALGSLLDNDLDRQYRFLSIPCILIAIVPLLPSLGWFGKLLPLWPLAIILFVPTTIIALFRKISGAKLFLAACSVGILGALCALIAMLIGMPATIINAIPLCGTALCALCLAGVHGGSSQSSAELMPENTQAEPKPTMTIHADYDDPLLGEGLRLVSAEEGLATGIVFNGEVIPDGKCIGNDTATDESTTEPLRVSSSVGKVRAVQAVASKDEQESLEITSEPDDDAGLVAKPIEAEQTSAIPESSEIEPSEEPNTELNDEPITQVAPSVAVLEMPSQSLAASLRGPLEQDDVHTLARAEEAMRYPLENLRKSLDSLQKCAVNPDTKALCQDAANASKQLDLVGEEFRRATYRLPTESASMIFDLQSCLREAHDNVCERSDAKNIALSWFMAPHLVQTYQGDEDRLRTTLRVLMESAVDATDKGSVYLSARRVPDSTNPGHLLFTITDTGAGGPPERRKASALMQAWELATSTGGSLSIDSGIHGTTISFSTRFLAIHNENAPTSPMQHRANGYHGLANSMHTKSGKQACIVIAAPAASNRQLLAFYLEDTAYYAEEAVSALDIMAKYTSHGAELIILDGDMNETESNKVIATARQYEAENDLPPVPFLALVRDEAQADAFLQRGCTQTLLKPVTRSGLCAQVALLAPIVLMPKAMDEIQDGATQGDAMQDAEAHNAAPTIAANQQNIIAPELINAALTEAMELLTKPAQQPSSATEQPENLQESYQEPIAEVRPESTTLVQEQTPELIAEPTQEPTQESATEPQEKAQAEPETQAVPTSEAEDITLRLFEEHLQNEKSSVSASMLDLDPILFTDIISAPSPKTQKRKDESSITLNLDNDKLDRDEFDRDESVSEVRIMAPKELETVAETTSALDIQEPKAASPDLPSLESPNQFVYNDVESEVSKPRPVQPMHEDADHVDVAPMAKPEPKPELRPELRSELCSESGPESQANEVCVEAISVGSETLRLYKDPTKQINPDDEYAAMLEREAQLFGQQNTTQAPQAVTWCDASEIAEQIAETESVIVAMPAPIAEPILVAEPEPVEPEPAEPIQVQPEPVVEAESIIESVVPMDLDQPIELERPIAPVHEIEYVEPIQTATRTNEIVADEIAPQEPTPDEVAISETEAKELESGEPEPKEPEPKELDLEKPNAVARVTSTLFNVYNKLREPAPLNIKDKTLPSLNKIREVFEAASLIQEQNNVQEAPSEPRRQEQNHDARNQDEQNQDEQKPEEQKPEEQIQEEQSPRFVSIVQGVSEIAATIKPTPTIARNTSHKNFVPQLIAELENAMAEAITGYEQDDIGAMQDAAARVADTAEALGLRRLERSTRCVERAAAANDLISARELYADMEQTIQHTLTALRSSGLDGAHRM